MVDWYSPSQLARTGIKSVISTVFGQMLDRRMLEVPGSPGLSCTDLCKFDDGTYRDELVVDYVSDTGDGWNSTYAVAYWVSLPELQVNSPSQPAAPTSAPITLRRGDALIFGGDQVYPVASRAEYQARFAGPYRAASPETKENHPKVFAVPGNHDWYDGLVAFSRLFLHRQWFAGWKREQTRSYFAVKLPGGWWIVGTDIQLGTDLDFGQVDYFKELAKQIGPDDRIILCNAMPYWVYDQQKLKRRTSADEKMLKNDPQFDENLEYLTNKVFAKNESQSKVAVFLAGDLHHYCRYANDEGLQKFTAGGGGAFLHPTHVVPEGLNPDFKAKAHFPPVNESRKLTWRNLGFAVKHKMFGLLLGILYCLTAWSVMADIGPYSLHQLIPALHATLRAALQSPIAPFWGLALFGGIVLFTDSSSRLFRWVGGITHGLAHLAICFVSAWAVARLEHHLGWPFKSTRALLLSGLWIVATGPLLGSVLFGLYLLISLNVFREHQNEAFSALAVEDWKSFLRFKVSADGNLTIYPIGIRRVPRKWEPTGGLATEPAYRPNDPAATHPELIEPPILITAQRQVIAAGGGTSDPRAA